MKKTILCMMTIFIMSSLFCGCGSQKDPGGQEDGKIKIVTTVFPVYDWVENILGDNPAGAEVTFLLSEGVDPHSFQPTVEDILKISECDLFVYVGGESDDWVEDALKEALNKEMISLNLLDILGESARPEEMMEGMQSDTDESGEEDNDPFYDEHVWLSLKNASLFVSHIEETLEQIDAEHGDIYRENADRYMKSLDALDGEYQEMVASSSEDTLLFGDRFPFLYLVRDYGLYYYAAFAGCSAETEASFETITFLAQKMDELSLPAVLTIEGTDHKIAETIIQNTKEKNQKILTLDSMQSITGEEVEEGLTYLSVMKKNLDIIREALNREE